MYLAATRIASKLSVFIIALLVFSNCSEQKPKTILPAWSPYDESAEIAANAANESVRLRYKLIQSQVTDKNIMLKNIEQQLDHFSQEDYLQLMPLIYEQNIATIQGHVANGSLSYESLTKWYLYRIAKYENNRETYLNGIISINPDAVKLAKQHDKTKSDNDHPIFGIPVLLKDNVNFSGVPTTAGAHALKDNYTQDAFIVERIKANGGIILGKTNLSEWANYNCLQCPNGFSAVGGQTLNAYGRKIFDTGGSSSGSGVSIAANYAAVAVGTETSGSILSPSSSSSLVGLKPTVGLLSRGGIVPISSTLDTPGPMTRSVLDNAILLSAMAGEDPMDAATKDNPKDKSYFDDLAGGTLKGLRLGVNSAFLSDSVYKANVALLSSFGAETITFDPPEVELVGFSTLLRGDMLRDLAYYLTTYGDPEIAVKSAQDVVNHNLADSTLRIPYGHGRFAGILEEQITDEELVELRKKLNEVGKIYFEEPMTEHNLDAVLFINNAGAGYAAAAKYPCLTVPMGYNSDGRPMGLTFIARPFEEGKLLKMGYAFEKATSARKPPQLFQ